MRASSTPGEELRAGHHGAAIARDRIEAVLLRMPDVVDRFDREGVRDRLLRAIQAAYAVLDTGPLALVHLEGLVETGRIVEEVTSLLPRTDSPALRAIHGDLAMARSAVTSGREVIAKHQLANRTRLHAGQLGEPPPPRPFRASVGTPTLFALRRRPLVPEIDVAPRKPPREAPRPTPRVKHPTSLEELRSLGKAARSGVLFEELGGRVDPVRAAPPAPPPPPPPFEPAVEETEVVRNLARAYLDRLAGGRTLRHPNPIETWRDIARFDQRILDALDALLALGPAIFPALVLFVGEGQGEDPDRAFAAALVLGSVEGHDTVGVLSMMIKQSRPEAYPGFVEGLVLAPSPAVDAMVGELAGSTNEAWVELGVEVLARRRTLSAELATALVRRAMGARSRIAVQVARGLRDASDRDEASRVLDELMADDEDEVALAAATTSLVLGRDATMATLLAWLRAPSSPRRARGALVLLLLVGRAEHVPELLDAADRLLDWEVARAVGRLGATSSLSLLCARLGEDADRDHDLAEALERITGAGLRVVEEVPWEVELPEGAPPIDPGLIPSRRVERISTDPTAWRRWLAANRLDGGVKWRGGRPFELRHVVDELEAVTTPPARRPEAALELALHAGPAAHIDVTTWVARQEGRLAELRGVVDRIRYRPGAWSAGLGAPEPPVDELAPPPSVTPANLRGTMMGTFDLGAILPFLAGGPRPGQPEPSPAPAAAASREPPGRSTMPSAPPPAHEPSPTAGPPRSAVVRPPAALSSTAPLGDDAMAKALAELRASPFVGRASRRAPPPIPPIPLDRYVALVVALEQAPHRAPEILRSFGLADARELAVVDQAWQQRLRDDPALLQQWHRLVDEARRRPLPGAG